MRRSRRYLVLATVPALLVSAFVPGPATAGVPSDRARSQALRGGDLAPAVRQRPDLLFGETLGQVYRRAAGSLSRTAAEHWGPWTAEMTAATGRPDYLTPDDVEVFAVRADDPDDHNYVFVPAGSRVTWDGAIDPAGGSALVARLGRVARAFGAGGPGTRASPMFQGPNNTSAEYLAQSPLSDYSDHCRDTTVSVSGTWGYVGASVTQTTRRCERWDVQGGNAGSAYSYWYTIAYDNNGVTDNDSREAVSVDVVRLAQGTTAAWVFGHGMDADNER